MLSLPRIFGTILSTIPSTVPYLKANHVLCEQWKTRMNSHQFNVGLVWRGSLGNAADTHRSFALSNFSYLGNVKNVTFYSLQKGIAAEEVKSTMLDFELIDLTDKIKDFADTAALIANLDLIISVDTSVVHLAGALGKPVWVLLGDRPDWRWLMQRLDTPWYPSIELFRRQKPDDWASAMRMITQRLANIIDRKGVLSAKRGVYTLRNFCYK